MGTFKITLPAYLGPALINADFSGLSNEDADNAREGDEPLQCAHCNNAIGA